MKIDRRKFCKLTGLSALAVMVNPAKAVAAVAARGAMPRRCTVEVLRCECYRDLQCRYLDDPEAGRCPRFHVGQKLTVTRANVGRMSDENEFCPKAWHAIEPYVMDVIETRADADCMNAESENAKIVCCPDGTRPVVFKITRS